jgi:hypothetical protein
MTKKKSHRPVGRPPKPVPQQGKQELLLHLKSCVRLPDGTEIAPGANQVSPAVIAMVRTHDLMKRWLAKGLLSIREQVPEPGSVEYDLSMGLPVSLLGLSLDTIRSAIEQCRSRDQIQQWLLDAGNPDVRSLLIDRSYEISREDSVKTQPTEAFN